MENKIYGYLRVSTLSQLTDRQMASITDYIVSKKLIVEKIYEDKITGKKFVRPGYSEMKSTVKSGDTVIIKELDRLGRDWELIKQELNWFVNNDINLVIVDQPYLTEALGNPKDEGYLTRKLVKNIIVEITCYKAQEEREKISRRTKEGMIAAKERGSKVGRKEKYTEIEIRQFYDEYIKGDKTMKMIANEKEIPLITIQRRFAKIKKENT